MEEKFATLSAKMATILCTLLDVKRSPCCSSSLSLPAPLTLDGRGFGDALPPTRHALRHSVLLRTRSAMWAQNRLDISYSPKVRSVTPMTATSRRAQSGQKGSEQELGESLV